MYSKASRYTALRYMGLDNTRFWIVSKFLRCTNLCSENLQVHEFLRYTKICVSQKFTHLKVLTTKISASQNWIWDTPIIKCWPSAARFLKSWTLYNILLTLWCTILRYTSFFHSPKNVHLKALLYFHLAKNKSFAGY